VLPILAILRQEEEEEEDVHAGWCFTYSKSVLWNAQIASSPKGDHIMEWCLLLFHKLQLSTALLFVTSVVMWGIPIMFCNKEEVSIN
jgi:hypothetical protein